MSELVPYVSGSRAGLYDPVIRDVAQSKGVPFEVLRSIAELTNFDALALHNAGGRPVAAGAFGIPADKVSPTRVQAWSFKRQAEYAADLITQSGGQDWVQRAQNALGSSPVRDAFDARVREGDEQLKKLMRGIGIVPESEGGINILDPLGSIGRNFSKWVTDNLGLVALLVISGAAIIYGVYTTVVSESQSND